MNERIAPTPETRRKAREGVIGILAKRKFLWPEHVNAAFDIEEGYRAFIEPVSCRLMKFKHDGWLHRRPESLATATDRLVKLMHQYFDWSETLAESGRGLVHAVTMDIAVEGLSLREVHTRREIGVNQVKHVLKDGLQEYAKLTGRLTGE